MTEELRHPSRSCSLEDDVYAVVQRILSANTCSELEDQLFGALLPVLRKYTPSETAPIAQHSTEDNYQHFLSYSNLAHSDLLRYAYFHGADADCEKPKEPERMRAALETIAGGLTDRFPGAPDPMTATSPADFRSAMWVWSQQIAKNALKEKL